MKYEQINKRLTNDGVVYIKDDYEEIAVRLVWDGKKTAAYIKMKGHREVLSSTSTKSVFDVTQEGVEITKEEYDNY